MRPPSSARSVGWRPRKGDPGVPTATNISEVIAWSAALKTAGITELVASEPPEIGPSGSALSPSSTSILSTGTPVFSDASCARIVYVPVPMSCVAQATRMVPSSRNCMFAPAANLPAAHTAPAMPQPSFSPSRFIEPTAGLRFDQPNFSAPRFKHST